MDRASGRYRRQTQWIVLAIAAAMTIGLDADTILVARHLSRTPAAREAVVARAAGVPAVAGAEYGALRAQIDSLALPIGWPRDVDTAGEHVDGARRHALGWLLTVLAVSLGAPFWFDVLNKLMVIRSTVKPFEKSLPEGSEDRNGPTPTGAGNVATWTPLPIAQGPVPATTTLDPPHAGPMGTLLSPR